MSEAIIFEDITARNKFIRDNLVNYAFKLQRTIYAECHYVSNLEKFLKSKSDIKISLKQLIQMLNYFYNSRNDRNSVYSYCYGQSNEINSFFNTATKPAAICKVFFKDLTDKKINNISSENTGKNYIEEFLDQLISTLPDQEIKKYQKSPFTAKFPTLSEQFRIHLQRVSTKEEVNQALARAYYPDGSISEFAQTYKQAPSFFGKETKRNLRQKLDQSALPHLNKDLQTLEKIFTFLAGQKTRAEILKSTKPSQAQQNEAALLEEVVEIYQELADSLSQELEIKIRVPQLVSPNLIDVLNIMEQFGTTGENTLDILQKSIAKAQAIQEARDL